MSKLCKCDLYAGWVKEITHFTDLDVMLAHTREVMIPDMYYITTFLN